MVARGGGSLPEATAVKRRLRALAVEPAEEIRGGAVPLFRVAFQTAGDEVGVGIAPQLDARHDMVEGAHEGGKVAQTVKAEAHTRASGWPAESLGFHEIRLLEAGSEGQRGRGALPEPRRASAPRPRDRLWCDRPSAERRGRRGGVQRCARGCLRGEHHGRARQSKSAGGASLPCDCGAEDGNTRRGR